MIWVLIIHMTNANLFGGTMTTAGPFRSQSECVAVERQVHTHYSHARGYYPNTVCASGAR